MYPKMRAKGEWMQARQARPDVKTILANVVPARFQIEFEE
jgi:hypothetical protein